MTVKTIVDNHKLYEATFFGTSGVSHEIDVSTLTDAVQINGVDKQRMHLKLCYSMNSGGYLKFELDTNSSGSYSEYWRGYGNGEILIKNLEPSGNGDFKITFQGTGGSCHVYGYKTEGFVQASPYYKKVSGRIVT